MYVVTLVLTARMNQVTVENRSSCNKYPSNLNNNKPTTSNQKQTFDALLSIASAAVEALEKPKIAQRSDSLGIQSTSSPQNGPVDVLLPMVLTDVRNKSSASREPSENTPENTSIRSKSSTASEILVRTTNTDPGVYKLSESLNLSNTSKASNNSKVSTTSSTFLTGDAKRVKISSKKLKEIKSPFEESASAGNLGFLKMLDSSSLLNSPSKVTDKSASLEVDISIESRDRDGKKGPISTKLTSDKDKTTPLAVETPFQKNVTSDSKCGKKVKDVSVSVIKHHSVRKHTTEHNHAVVVERHNIDTNVSQLGEHESGSDNERNAKQRGENFTSGLDSGYQTKQLSVKALQDMQEIIDLRNTTGSQANTSADIEGNSIGINGSTLFIFYCSPLVRCQFVCTNLMLTTICIKISFLQKFQQNIQHL